jgi:hypothetical protein
MLNAIVRPAFAVLPAVLFAGAAVPDETATAVAAARKAAKAANRWSLALFTGVPLRTSGCATAAAG